MDRTSHLLTIIVLIGAAVLSTDGIADAGEGKDSKPLRAGAFAIDITPEKLPEFRGHNTKLLISRCLALLKNASTKLKTII